MISTTLPENEFGKLPGLYIAGDWGSGTIINKLLQSREISHLKMFSVMCQENGMLFID